MVVETVIETVRVFQANNNNACNSEDYAKIWTRPHLDTVYKPIPPRVSHCTVLVLYTMFCLKWIWVPGMCPEPHWIAYQSDIACYGPGNGFVSMRNVRAI